MNQIIIVGAGGHAAELNDYIKHCNDSRPENKLILIGLIDDNQDNHRHYSYSAPYLGSVEDHEVRLDVQYLMGIANLSYRKPIIEKFLAKGAKFTGLIHPTAIISPTATIGEGTVVSHNVSVGAKANIGKFNMLNSRCTIGHDSVLGDYNFISPQVALSGRTTIGNENLFGTNSATIPKVEVGNNNIVGAGTVVIKNIDSGKTVVPGTKPRTF